MNRSGEEQERVLLYLEEEAGKKQRRKLPVRNGEPWKGAGRGCGWGGLSLPSVGCVLGRAPFPKGCVVLPAPSTHGGRWGEPG